MAKYILIVPMGGKAAGEELELTEDQAQHPLYRYRVRKKAEDAQLVVATPKPEKAPRKSKGAE